MSADPLPEMEIVLTPDEYVALYKEIADDLIRNGTRFPYSYPQGPVNEKIRTRLIEMGWVPFQPVRVKVWGRS